MEEDQPSCELCAQLCIAEQFAQSARVKGQQKKAFALGLFVVVHGLLFERR